MGWGSQGNTIARLEVDQLTIKHKNLQIYSLYLIKVRAHKDLWPS